MTTAQILWQRLLTPSCVGAVLTLLLLLLRPLTKTRFSSGWHYFMWCVVLVIMVLPVRLPLPAQVPTVQTTIVTVTQTVITPLREVSGGDTPVRYTIWDVAAWVWLAVAVGLFVGKAVRYVVGCRRLQQQTEAVTCPVIRALTPHRVAVRRGAAISSPFLSGVFRPTIYLPDIPLTDEQMAHVFAHETVHWKRGDLWMKWIALAVKCLHWYNPAVYLAHRQFEEECEISCDMVAVKGWSDEQITDYLQTVLYLLRARSHGDCPQVDMAGNGRLLKRRFRTVRENRGMGRVAAVLAATLAGVLIVSAVGVSGMTAPEASVPPLSFSTKEETPPGALPDTPSATSGFLWPCPGKAEITACYDQGHTGLDIRLAVGDTVVAAADGYVVSCVRDTYNGGYGLTVTVDHGVNQAGERFQTKYAHLSNIKVSVGDTVIAGQPIAAGGMSGVVTGPCLHFAVLKEGEEEDPLLYLPVTLKEVVGDAH